MNSKRALVGRALSRVVVAVIATAGLLLGVSSPANAGGNQTFTEEAGVGYFYGTFGEDQNILLLAGGTAQEFCDDKPKDPFNAEPGTTTQRVRIKKDGTVKIKTNDRHQPVYLYYTGDLDGPPWISQVCETYFATGDLPQAFASGTAKLKVRLTIFPDGVVDVFNSVRGKVTGTDGTCYRVRGSADLVVGADGIPQGNPEDFVSFNLKEKRRC